MSGLSEAERSALLAFDLEYANMHADWAQSQVFAAVERIIADREKALRESIAQEIEAARDSILISARAARRKGVAGDEIAVAEVGSWAHVIADAVVKTIVGRIARGGAR